MNTRKHNVLCFGLLLMGLLFSLFSNAQFAESAQNASPFYPLDKEAMFKPFAALELWGTYSTGERTGESGNADRGDVSLRRFRFGATGKPYAWLSYSFQLHFDRIGEDNFAATKGSYSGIGLWNAYITAQLLKNSDFLNLHAGYYWAAVSRQYNTSPWAVGAFDKTRACWYLRSFVTGKGNGIESGIGIGGLKNFGNFGISYRLGTFEPEAYSNPGFSDRLYTGRIMFSIGDPEQTSYNYMLSGNQWRERRGITLSFGGSQQANGKLSDSLLFSRSTSYGSDLLINFEGLRIEGEYYQMLRKGADLPDYKGTQWHVLAGYSFLLAGKYVEPVICFEKYSGEGSKVLFKHVGSESTLDIGINWYLNTDKLKLAMHYVIQQGSTLSNIGDFLGIAFQVRL